MRSIRCLTGKHHMYMYALLTVSVCVLPHMPASAFMYCVHLLFVGEYTQICVHICTVYR